MGNFIFSDPNEFWGDDDGDYDDSTASEQGNVPDSDNLPDWQQ